MSFGRRRVSMPRHGAPALAVLIGGYGQSGNFRPGIRKPWRPALETAKGIEKQLDRRIDDLKPKEEEAMKNDAR